MKERPIEVDRKLIKVTEVFEEPNIIKLQAKINVGFELSINQQEIQQCKFDIREIKKRSLQDKLYKVFNQFLDVYYKDKTLGDSDDNF